MDQKRKPMNKNRIKRPTVLEERACDREVHIHQEHYSPALTLAISIAYFDTLGLPRLLAVV